MNTDFIDRIYEASFVPELWPGVLDELATLADSEGGLLFSARDKVLSWTTTDNMHDVFHSYLTDGWFARCGRRVCMFNNAHSEFLVETDYWTEKQIEENEIYNDFFRPRGLGWSAGTGLLMPTGDQIVFSVERTLDRGVMEKNYVQSLNKLRPHLARAAMVAARLGLKSATSAKETLSKLGLPTILLDASGRVIEKSDKIDDLSEYLIWGHKDSVALKDKDANDLLKSALQTLVTHPQSTVSSFPVRDVDKHAALVAHIIPISRSAHDLFAKSYALLVLTPVSAKNVPSAELVRSLFDLTASEARIARGLAAGETLEDLANTGNVALTTVRTQLRRVMEKTGCTRQAEIVALMANISLQR